MDKILVIIPTYNEKENIENIIKAVLIQNSTLEILIVDDNSPDGTGKIADQIALTQKRVNVLHREAKNGLGRAYIAGFKFALTRDYTHIFEMDADFSHDPKYIPDFIEKTKTHDLVIGSRYICGVNVINWPMQRLLLSYTASIGVRFVTGLNIKDTTGGYKCFKRIVLESLDLDKITSEGYSFQIEINFIAWKMGFKIAEIPIIFHDRTHGVSKMSSKIIKEALLLLWKLRIKGIFSPIKRIIN